MSAEILAALAIVLAAGVVAGITGFGLTITSAPALLLIFEPVTVVILNAILALVTGLVIVAEAWREIRLGAVIVLLPWSLLGLVVGSQLLVVLDPDHLKLIAGIVVLCSALLLAHGLALTQWNSRWAPPIVGASSGLLATSTGFPSPLAALLFTARGFTKDSLRATSAAYFSCIGLIGLVIVIGRGLSQDTHPALAMVFIPAAILGKILGSIVLRRLSDELFRRIVLIVAITAGVMGISTATLSLI